MARARRVWLRRSALGVGGLVLAIVVAAICAVVWLHTRSGHVWVARKIESFVDGQISGTMRVGEVTDVSAHGVHAHDVRFFAPDGGEVLVADDVDLRLSWLGLLSGRFVSSAIRVRGGRVILRENTGGLGIDLAFRNPSPGDDDAMEDPPPLDLQRIEATGIAFSARLRGTPALTVGGLRGVFRVWVPHPGGSAQLDAHDLAGQLDFRAPIPVALAIDGGTFQFDGAARRRAHIELAGVLNGSHVTLGSDVLKEADGTHVDVRLRLPDVGAVLRSAPLVAEASALELAGSHFNFSVNVGSMPQ